MADYTLDRDEAVILKELLAGYGPPMSNIGTFELVLTNRKLVLLKKAFIKTSPAKEVRTFPINQIKVFNGQAQVVLTDRTAIEIYFQSGPENFRFHLNAVAVRWVEQINLLATGRESEVVLDNEAITAGSPEFSRAMMKEAFGTAFGRSGAKPRTPDPVVKATGKCDHCGARIEGYEGRWATCEYCGNPQQLGQPVPSQPMPAQPVPGPVAPRPTATGPPVPGPAPLAAPRPAPAPAAGWKPDPKRAHEFRWWGGRAWTAHVADHGVTKYDPL